MIRMLLTETMPNIPALKLKDFDPNAVVRIIANTVITLAMIAGVLTGVWQAQKGLNSQNPQDTHQGITIMVGSIALGAMGLTILNLIIF